ncbi:MAG: branched-chain alpha-keto acid dehydrogenase subunit E2 [Halobacteriales archaeon SW_9_67_25]|jgi:pyruvate dehydrogenase E2 component (dihydrolipoamide acetyltransferase)|nr:MAG: branched-chain alpha-keto acid dehydrogenase subunit E2 [Halobacteriales archaeon SW_9_67_25]
MFEFELPDVGEGVAEGEIVAWHVAPGDGVEEDQVLAEVETDKAVVDLPSPVAGTVRELLAEEGEVVPVGNVVVTIDAAGDEPDPEEVDVDAGVDGADEEPTESAGESDDESATAGGRVFAPPNVRRLARELGVDLAAVDGSGPGGRVTEGDVRAAADQGAGEERTAEPKTESVEAGDGEQASAEAATTAAEAGGDGQGASTARASDRDRTLTAPATRKLAREEGVDIDEVPTEKTRDGEAFVEPEDVRAYVEARETVATGATAETPATAGDAEPATADTATTEAVTTEPYRGIRRTIGQQMEESAFTAPHACHHDTAVVDDLVAARADLKERAAERDVRLTYVPFVMKAIVAGLKEYPVLNTELDEEGEEILYKHYYNIGLAVATDAGLMVPVVEDVDGKGLLDLAAEANDIAQRARSRDLELAEMKGGTFTITNFGAIGGEYATPIINYPETAILGLGAIEERPVAEDGEVFAAQTLPLSLSIDHRVIDGAEAAGFVNTVIEYLENPTLLLLE